MRIILLLLLGIGVGSCVVAQGAKTDSLLKALSKHREDTARVVTLILLGESYESNKPDTAKKYMEEALELSRKLKYDRGEYFYHTYVANVNMIQGDYASALRHQESALQLAEKMKDTGSIGVSLFNIGVNHRDNGHLEKAIEYCLKGRPLIEKKAKPGLLVQVDDALQVLYHTRTEYGKALEYGKKAVARARSLNMRSVLSTSLVNLSLSQVSFGQLDAAMANLKEALKIALEDNDIRVQATCYLNMGGLALKRRSYPELKDYLEKSLVLYREVGMKQNEASAIRSMGITALQMGNVAEAKAYALNALDSSRKYGFRYEEIGTLKLLSHIAYAQNNWNEGLDYDEKMTEGLEALVKAVLSERSAELEKKYETEKKENRILQLESEQKIQELRLRQKNIANYILIGGALALLLILLLLYRNYRHKQALQQKRINELQTEKLLAATEAVLKGEEKERTRLAKDLHDGLGGMLSGIKYSFNTMKGNLVMTPENMRAFERGIEMLDSSISEMRRVAHNLMPEALVKFGLDTALKDFCSDINLSGSLRLQYQSVGLENASIDSNTSITVYRIVQELVGNVLKHAAATRALVQVVCSETGISVTVEDDGKGFDTAVIRNARGIGWSNITSRVEYLKGRMDVRSEPGKGTSVLIEVPA